MPVFPHALFSSSLGFDSWQTHLNVTSPTFHIYKMPFVPICSLLACIRSGAGTFGVVYKGIDVDTEDAIALKKIKMEKEKHGFPITAIREIKILKELQHKNIVRLREIGN